MSGFKFLAQTGTPVEASSFSFCCASRRQGAMTEITNGKQAVERLFSCPHHRPYTEMCASRPFGQQRAANARGDAAALRLYHPANETLAHWNSSKKPPLLLGVSPSCVRAARLNSAGHAGFTSALVPYKEQKALLSLEPVGDTGRAAHDYSVGTSGTIIGDVVAHN